MINVLLQTESHYPLNRKKIKEAIAAALKGRVRRDAEVSLAIVGDRQMRKLNKTYRGADATTDVLSFAFNEPGPNDKPFMNPPDNLLHLGDIVISYPQAVSAAQTANRLVDDQLIFLALHGLNHLLGIHHPE